MLFAVEQHFSGGSSCDDLSLSLNLQQTRIFQLAYENSIISSFCFCTFHRRLMFFTCWYTSMKLKQKPISRLCLLSLRKFNHVFFCVPLKNSSRQSICTSELKISVVYCFSKLLQGINHRTWIRKIAISKWRRIFFLENYFVEFSSSHVLGHGFHDTMKKRHKK